MVFERGDERLMCAVLRVGDGRGFVVSRKNHLGHTEKIVITAAHCLPRLEPPYEQFLALPPPHPARYSEEEIYRRLLGPLGVEPMVSPACLFADPMADIAVLGRPDDQALSVEAEAYDRLLDKMEVLLVAGAPSQGIELITIGELPVKRPTSGKGSARVLSLEGHWVEGCIERWDNRLAFEPEKVFVGGMSGSPIVDDTGAAIGVVSVDMLSPVLTDSLPGWLLRSVKCVRRQKHS